MVLNELARLFNSSNMGSTEDNVLLPNAVSNCPRTYRTKSSACCCAFRALHAATSNDAKGYCRVVGLAGNDAVVVPVAIEAEDDNRDRVVPRMPVCSLWCPTCRLSVPVAVLVWALPSNSRFKVALKSDVK